MYKLLIVEDEASSREGLNSTINWSANGISICAQAENGLEALHLLEVHQPDIILSDIRMPKMSGLDFLKRARRTEFAFEFILLTGYDDFEYAQKALKLGVFDYILKPAKPADILQIVLRAIDKLEQKQMLKQQIEQLQKNWDKNKFIVKQQQLTNWLIHSEQTTQAKRVNILQELETDIHDGDMHLGIIQLTHNAQPIKDYRFGGAELFNFATLNITLETLGPVYQGKMEVFHYNDLFIWIANLHTSFQQDFFKDRLSILHKNLVKYLNISDVCFGISAKQSSIHQIHELYRQAQEALKLRYYKKECNIFYYEKQNRDNVDDPILYDAELATLEAEIIQHMHSEMYAAALDKLENWLSHIQKNSQYDKNEVNLKAMALIYEMQRFIHEKKLTTIQWKDDVVNWVEQIPNLNTFVDLATIIKKIYQSIVEILKSKRSLHRTIRSSLEIIHRDYSQNLTLDSVANAVYVSSAYLSSLFKQELGINFLDYLHQYRIEQSKPLLLDNYKIYEVSQTVGYKDERHYSQTFKKWTGMTPSQFRKKKG